VLDAGFTLLLIQHGSVELNPFLSWFLHKHVLLFFLVKYFLTSLCVILTVMHGQFRIFGVKGIHFLTGSVVVYTFLIQYQLSMLLPFWLNHSV
ncbi:MAG: DUF5658 family protein, partial [Gammaproteobacteria bacterium]